MPYSPFEDRLVCRICGSSLDVIKEEERYEVDEGAYIDYDGSVNEEDISFYYIRFWGCDECGWVFYSEKVYAWCNEYQLSKEQIKIEDLQSILDQENEDVEDVEDVEDEDVEDNNLIFPTGLSSKQWEEIAHKRSFTNGSSYEEELINVAEENAVVADGVDQIKQWLVKIKPILQEKKICYIPEDQLPKIQKEISNALFGWKHKNIGWVWMYCHFVHCCFCPDHGHCSRCDDKRFTPYPADSLNDLLTNEMKKRLNILRREPTLEQMVIQMFPKHIINMSIEDINEIHQDKADRDHWIHKERLRRAEADFEGDTLEDRDNE